MERSLFLRLGRIVFLTAVLGTLVAAPTAAVALTAAPPVVPGLPSAYGSISPLTFHGGWVQSNPVVHLIFWGPRWSPSDPVAIAEQTLFRELAGTGYNALLGQYGVHNDVRLAGVWFDRSAPPSRRSATDASLLAEALRARRVRHWRDSRDSQWVILPQSGANLRAFPSECGDHDLQWSSHKPYMLAMIPPFQEPMFGSGCIYDYSSDDGTSPTTSIVAGTTSVTSHEYAESATDPTDSSGWVTGRAASPVEVADLCYFYSGMPTGLTVTVSYLWDNALQSRINGCML